MRFSSHAPANDSAQAPLGGWRLAFTFAAIASPFNRLRCSVALSAAVGSPSSAVKRHSFEAVLPLALKTSRRQTMPFRIHSFKISWTVRRVTLFDSAIVVIDGHAQRLSSLCAFAKYQRIAFSRRSTGSPFGAKRRSLRYFSASMLTPDSLPICCVRSPCAWR